MSAYDNDGRVQHDPVHDHYRVILAGGTGVQIGDVLPGMTGYFVSRGDGETNGFTSSCRYPSADEAIRSLIGEPQ